MENKKTDKKNNLSINGSLKMQKMNSLKSKEPNLSHIKKSLKELREGKGTVHNLLFVDES